MSTVVYKYRLWGATLNGELVDAAFARSLTYKDDLISVENRRRRDYRSARSLINPEIGELEKDVEARQELVESLYQVAREYKKKSRSRQVPAKISAAAAEAKSGLKNAYERMKTLVQQLDLTRHYLEKLASRPHLLALDEVKTLAEQAREKPSKKLDRELALAVRRVSPDPESPAERLRARSVEIDARADEEVKALRKTLYWGTYLLLEDAWKQAKRDEPGWLSRDERPDHLRRGRIGIQIQGGITRDELASCTDTRIQLKVPNIEHAGEKPSVVGLPTRVCKPRGIFRLRVGTVEKKREPIWAEFPIKFHRALPKDAVIKWAIVTRTPGHLYRPWKYHLCLTVETSEYARTVPGTNQEGTCAINFGWRLEGGTLRVATLNNDAGAPEHVHLPKIIFDRFDTCKGLQSVIDRNFDDAKKELADWISGQASLPEAFKESFAGLRSWRSQRRLCELVDYWREHRLPGDDEVFKNLWYWRGRWIHLYQWCTCNRQRAIATRTDFYRNLAKRIATTSAKVVVEDFKIPKVARRAKDDVVEEGGKAARENRARAAVGDLRLCVLQACAKYHCEAVQVKSRDNTRRCNNCGRASEWNQASEVTHDCPDCGARWDQDVNNTDNMHDRAASGAAAQLVTPAEKAEDGQIKPPKSSSFGAARRQAGKVAKKPKK